MDNLRVFLHLEVSVLNDFHESVQRGISFDFQVLHHEIPIVNTVVSELLTNVTNLDTW